MNEDIKVQTINSPPTPVLASLLGVTQECCDAGSLDRAAYVMVNRSFELVPYRLAALWQADAAGSGYISHASGLANIDSSSPFIVWLQKLCASQTLDSPAQVIVRDALPATLTDEWASWLPEHVLWLPLPAPAGQPAAGALLLARDAAFETADVARLQALARFYGHSLWAWRRGHIHWRARLRNLLKSRRSSAVLVAVIALLLFPFRQSVVVPAEIAPLAPSIIAAPADTTIRTLYVRPNESVRKDQPLFALDDTATRNSLAVAEKSLDLAQAEWLRASQKAFSHDQSRAEVSALAARIEERRAEAAYLRELLDRLTVVAPVDGVVLFNDPAELIGTPVVTGQRIMMLADPGQVGVLAWLPPFDAIALEPGAHMVLSLHTAPLSTIDARLGETSYESQLAPDGSHAYRILGHLTDSTSTPRLGMKGSVRLYGSRAPLIYHLLRRPLAGLRRLTGL